MDFLLAGFAAVGAGFFSNPLEVLKTRMQLQGELHAKGEYKVHYKNTLHSVYTVVKHDGVLSLQKGLAPALWVQFILNGVRLGVYQYCENTGYLYDKDGKTVFYKSVLAGGLGGIAGQVLSNPVFLVKTHLQTQSVETIAVGHQHNHKGTMEALRKIYKGQGVKSMEFVLAGTAACSACLFTNPLEVLKTRMQLQGELQKTHVIHYKNVIHAGYVVAKNDGITALQKGLVPALWVQLLMNGMRLGTYQFGESRGLLTDKDTNKTVFWRSVVVGGTGGVAGQFFASPFFLVKTHLQAQAAKAIAVGFQHSHFGTWKALKDIYARGGVKGLFRGAGASIPRAAVGSVSQLTSFKYSKEYLNEYKYFQERPLLTSFCGSMIGGVAISVMMTPFDLILTRLYNQPVDANGRGILYKTYMDCVVKIFKTEGVSAFYKGVGPMYLRLGPHSVLCLMFWDELNDLYKKLFP